MQDDERYQWLLSNRHLLISVKQLDGKIFRPGHMMDETQIATLYRGQRYEDEADVPPSDGRPMLRLRW